MARYDFGPASIFTTIFRPMRTLLVLTIVSLVLAACGGSATSPTAGEPTQTVAVAAAEPTVAEEPTVEPTVAEEPTVEPTVAEEPTVEPTVAEEPTVEPTVAEEPTEEATEEPTATEEVVPTEEPTITAEPGPPAQAVVRNQIVNIREGPSARKDAATGADIYKIITTRNQGDVLEVLGRGYLDFPWVQVKLDDGQTGWVSSDPSFAELTVPTETLQLVSWYPPNSVLQRTIELDGAHSMEVENLGERDAVLVLAQELAPVIAVYVRAGETYTVDGIPDGTFDVFDSRGSDWNGREFTTDATRSKWSEPLPFANNENGNPIIWTLTLDSGESDDGESQDSDPVDEGDFPGITTQE